MIRTIIRRLTLFPIIFVCSPILYFIGWCEAGHQDALETTIGIIHSVWYGDND